MKQPLTVTIKLTPEILELLQPELAKKILLDLITPKEDRQEAEAPASIKADALKGNKVLPDSLVEELYKRRWAGERLTDICREFNIPSSTLSSALTRLEKKKRG